MQPDELPLRVRVDGLSKAADGLQKRADDVKVPSEDFIVLRAGILAPEHVPDPAWDLLPRLATVSSKLGGDFALFLAIIDVANGAKWVCEDRVDVETGEIARLDRAKLLRRVHTCVEHSCC